MINPPHTLNNDAQLHQFTSEDGEITHRIVGDPTEGSILVAAAKAGLVTEYHPIDIQIFVSRSLGTPPTGPDQGPVGPRLRPGGSPPDINLQA